MPRKPLCMTMPGSCSSTTLIVHDVGCTKNRSTAVVGGRTILAPGLSLLKQFEELPQGLIGSARAEALAAIDRLYWGKALILADLTFDPTYAEIHVRGRNVGHINVVVSDSDSLWALEVATRRNERLPP